MILSDLFIFVTFPEITFAVHEVRPHEANIPVGEQKYFHTNFPRLSAQTMKRPDPQSYKTDTLLIGLLAHCLKQPSSLLRLTVTTLYGTLTLRASIGVGCV